MPTVIPAVPVYAGDAVDWPILTFAVEVNSALVPINLDAAGWGTWLATWKSSVREATAISLTVDASEASVGTIKIKATPANTRAMRSSGVWDLQATNGALVKTWAYGTTKFTQDVTP